MTADERHKRTRSPYVTTGGYRALEAEAAALWQRRGEVTRALAAAAAEGDRSENAEYIYRKKELREIDRRIRFLVKRLDAAEVVDPEARARDGATSAGQLANTSRAAWPSPTAKSDVINMARQRVATSP